MAFEKSRLRTGDDPSMSTGTPPHGQVTYIKVFAEERGLTLILAVLIGVYGWDRRRIQQMAAKLRVCLHFRPPANKVGLLLFWDVLNDW